MLEIPRQIDNYLPKKKPTRIATRKELINTVFCLLFFFFLYEVIFLSKTILQTYQGVCFSPERIITCPTNKLHQENDFNEEEENNNKSDQTLRLALDIPVSSTSLRKLLFFHVKPRKISFLLMQVNHFDLDYTSTRSWWLTNAARILFCQKSFNW